MGVVIKGMRGIQNIGKLEAHVKYIGFRSIEAEDRGFFNGDSSNADYKQFLDRIKKDPALKHSMSIKAQKLIFSLKDVDYERYKLSGKNYKDLVRETLHQYEEKNGVKLDWIAAFHNKDGKGNSNHPHVHVVIKGVSDIKDSDGRVKRIKFTKDDFKFFRETFDKEFEKEAQFDVFHKQEIDKTMKDIGKGFEMITNNVKNEIKQRTNENEFLKKKEINKELRNKKNNDLER